MVEVGVGEGGALAVVRGVVQAVGEWGVVAQVVAVAGGALVAGGWGVVEVVAGGWGAVLVAVVWVVVAVVEVVWVGGGWEEVDLGAVVLVVD